MPYVSGWLIEGPVDPGYGRPGGGGGHPGHDLPGLPPTVGGGPIITPPVDPDYGRPTLPPSVGGGPILPPVTVMPPIHIPPTVGGGPMPPPGAIWPPAGGHPGHRPPGSRPPVAGQPLPPTGQPPQVGGGPAPPQPGRPTPPDRPEQGLPPHVGGGPTATRYLAMVILATDGGVVRTGWTIIDTSLDWPEAGQPLPPGQPPVAGQPLPPEPAPAQHR